MNWTAGLIALACAGVPVILAFIIFRPKGGWRW